MPTKKIPRKGGGVTNRHTDRRKSKEMATKEKKSTPRRHEDVQENIWKDGDFQKIRTAVRERFERKKHIRKVFRYCDKNKDGVIDSDELYDLFDMMGTGVSRGMSDRIHSLFDYDKNGKMQYAEFLALLFKNDSRRESKSSMKDDRKDDDVDKDQKINTLKRTEEEKKQLVQDVLGILRSRYQAKRSLQKVFTLWDKNRDGHISVDEMSEVFQFLGLKGLSEDDIRT